MYNVFPPLSLPHVCYLIYSRYYAIVSTINKQIKMTISALQSLPSKTKMHLRQNPHYLNDIKTEPTKQTFMQENTNMTQVN